MVFVVLLFGRDVPAFAVFLVIAFLVVGYFAAMKGAPHRVGFSGTGPMRRCERCGFDFQFERVEEMDNGEKHRFLDDRCPHCGWDEDQDNPDRTYN